MREYAGHIWVVIRYDTYKGVADVESFTSAKVSTEVGDALDQFLTNIFEGIRDDSLEVIMSEEEDDGQT